ncbi:MAG: phenylalanine--tRNA ligase subunit beta [Acidobacteria bacterium]|nr:phenylalanine--tRNA ligase subunit beta [Acidobacteriota bacterium]MBI3421450.1 phenylalanine--tRNA ligase subunit beta [Acidobacteriota bacterium]
MKISYNWLKEFVDIAIPPRQLAERLTMVGLAVDAVEEHGGDAVLEIDLTSNRPDCLSHLGVAREVAAILDAPLKKDVATGGRGDESLNTAALTSVKITAPELCPRYTARLIKGVKIGPSPDWLVKRLEVMGQRSVNNVADITNYVMLELGQPLHAFDFDMLRGQRLIVRRASEGEKIVTLDKEERTLTSAMLVIADAERPVALGGIKGGEDSGITDKTVDVLLEAAYFTPAQIRATSKALGLATEASYRFERGTDPEIAAIASDRAAALIAELAGGVISDELLDIYPGRQEGRDAIHAARQPIPFRRARYQALTGLDVELNTAARILGALGMPAEVDEAAQALTTVAPPWRIDIKIEEDLIEEVARIEGYDKLQTTLPGSAGAGSLLPGERERRGVRQALTAAGYHEAVSFSFVNAANDALFSEISETGRVGLSNPIDVELAQMRTNLLGGLLEALARNFNQGTRNVRLFEFGKCFAHADAERPIEAEKLALVATGVRNADDWQASALPTGGRLDFYDVKGVLETLAEVLSIQSLEFASVESAAKSPGYLHTGRAALIMHAGHTLGRVGQLHPRIATRYKFKQPVFVAELDFGAFLASERTEARYRPLPKFPQAQRDVALLIDTTVNFAALQAAIHALQIPELTGVRLFDLYAGKELPAGKHSLALSLSYRAANRTLTDEEVNAAHERVVQVLRETFGAEIR